MIKTYIKKALLLVITCLLSANIYAYDAKVNGIYYNLNNENKTASVTDGDESYKGNLSIPASISYEGENFTVTDIDGIAFWHCGELASIDIPSTINNSSFASLLTRHF